MSTRPRPHSPIVRPSADQYRQEWGVDDYALSQWGDLGGSFSLSLSGIDSYTTDWAGNDSLGTYFRETVGGGSWTRTGSDAGSGINGYTLSLDGDERAGYFNASHVGSDRYNLLEHFNDISNTDPGITTPGNVSFHSHGLPFRDPITPYQLALAATNQRSSYSSGLHTLSQNKASILYLEDDEYKRLVDAFADHLAKIEIQALPRGTTNRLYGGHHGEYEKGIEDLNEVLKTAASLLLAEELIAWQREASMLRAAIRENERQAKTPRLYRFAGGALYAGAVTIHGGVEAIANPDQIVQGVASSIIDTAELILNIDQHIADAWDIASDPEALRQIADAIYNKASNLTADELGEITFHVAITVTPAGKAAKGLAGTAKHQALATIKIPRSELEKLRRLANRGIQNRPSHTGLERYAKDPRSQGHWTQGDLTEQGFARKFNPGGGGATSDYGPGVVTGRNRGAFQGMNLTGETSKRKEKRASAEWRELRGPAAMRRHHLVPQEMTRNQAFMDRLEDLGYNAEQAVAFVNRQIADIPNVQHMQIHAEGWNPIWREWLRRNPNFEVSDIRAQVQSMMREFELPRSSRGGPQYGR